MPVALFIAGNFWLAAALTFWFGSRVVRYQPEMYGFLSSDPWFYPNTYYTCLAMLVSAAVICFVLSYAAWRRQHNPPMQSTGAAGAFPVIPASDESGPRH
jgi:hypothetical protein